jgi:hypothetical protein
MHDRGWEFEFTLAKFTKVMKVLKEFIKQLNRIRHKTSLDWEDLVLILVTISIMFNYCFGPILDARSQEQ